MTRVTRVRPGVPSGDQPGRDAANRRPASRQPSALLPPTPLPEPAPLEVASSCQSRPNLEVPPSTVEEVTVPAAYMQADELVEPTSITEPDAATAHARRFVRVFDAPAGAPAAPEHHASAPSVVERMLGAEQLTVLRARHAEILARISARGGDPARVEALREQAASVDPDGWVTEPDVTAGLASLDATLPSSIASSGAGAGAAAGGVTADRHSHPLLDLDRQSCRRAGDAEPETGDESEPDGTDDGPDE